MTDMGKHLLVGDPLADAPALPPDEVQQMRRAVVAAARGPAPAWWPRPVMVGATIAATLVAGVLIGRRLPHADPPALLPAGIVEGQTVEPARRQVQFDTPGGTRIIWVIDPDFDL
jgi:hypothetical protein